ncbi:Glyoxylase, beta-lactamase superfamily II [Fontimonas thermophila]|uniref:Glyoxylase, beta-lactamase superfamily II n=1 Tax=Fontimonas thermophila TaxID=1076937 RepID=A0A1I2IMB7_9GAMM|nr:MBL fold metallo-hydrolase [Fontimonas thermophila]SFF43489.1 Glyoxylase, beta-lactamase superfamily II [Fontimonas thermophila]
MTGSPLQVEVIPVTPFQQNCSLVWDADTQRGALIDAGGEPQRLLDAVQRRGVKLEKLLVTHGHLDHIGVVGELAQRLGLPIEGPHEDDAFWIELLPEAARLYGFPPAQRFTPSRWLRHGDRVSVGNIAFEVIHCPGHTPGHVVFYQPERRLAFVGDVLFQGSIGRTDFPRGNHADLIRSIRERLFPLGDDITFVPGHGPLSTFGEERRTNPFVGDGV